MMQFLRIYFNYILFTFGIREVLPREIVNKVVPDECHEPLVALSGAGIFIDGEARVRSSVSEMLRSVAKSLELNGYGLFVYEGYRSNEKQREHWDRVVEILKRNNTKTSDAEIEILAQKQVARPDGIGGGHQTGGAVDLTLCTLDGVPVSMGTEYTEFNERTKTNAHIENKEVYERRKILLSAMCKIGFVNYPNEWWHYSYGDRVWAAYLRKKTCPYDVL